MTIADYLSKAKFYRWIAGRAGVAQVIMGNVTKSETLLRVNRPDCRFPFLLRYPSSDIKTFRQVFVGKQYDFWAITQPRVIVDAGANIGLASIYFANKYPEAKIIAIEPENSNFELLKKNVAPYANIIPLQLALWHVNEDIELVDPGRGKWGFVTQEKESGKNTSEPASSAVCHTVKAITVDWLMEEYALDSIDLLKIDIEGAEKEVFSNTAAWIDKVNAIVIELHDFIRPGCLDSFDRGVRGFDHRWSLGENEILSKGQWLRKQWC